MPTVATIAISHVPTTSAQLQCVVRDARRDGEWVRAERRRPLAGQAPDRHEADAGQGDGTGGATTVIGAPSERQQLPGDDRDEHALTERTRPRRRLGERRSPWVAIGGRPVAPVLGGDRAHDGRTGDDEEARRRGCAATIGRRAPPPPPST